MDIASAAERNWPWSAMWFTPRTQRNCWGFPEIKLGCYPPVACTALAALVGQKRASELILTGRSISGKEAAGVTRFWRTMPSRLRNSPQQWMNVWGICESSALQH